MNFAKDLIIDCGEHVAAQPPFVDLAPFFAGEIELEVPTVAPIGGGKFLLYRGRINEFHAEPGTGKTNVAIAAAISVLSDGGKILVLDPEDNPRAYARRLRQFGCNPELVSSVSYLHNPTPEEIEESIAWASENPVDLVLLDGLAELMAGAGLSEDKADETIRFLKQYVRPFADMGAAVLLSDHVTKSTEGRGIFSRGSGAKLGRYDGIVYEICAGKAYTPDEEGFVKLKIAKDRQGGVGPRGTIPYEVNFEPAADGTTAIAFTAKDASNREEWKPTAIMGKIVSHLTLYTTDTKSGVANSIGGKRETVMKAIEILAKEGRISIIPQGNSHRLKLAGEGSSEA